MKKEQIIKTNVATTQIQMNRTIQVLVLALIIGLNTNSLATTVRASTFGWNATNATTAFVTAIKSANDTIIIDLQVSDWMIGPTNFDTLKNKTIIFENGVNLVARPGAFSYIYATLMTFYEAKNIKIIGYGAAFRMQKNEYIALNNSEHRHCIQLTSCSNIEIYGLKLMDSGGDGIIISNYTGVAYQRYCENVLLKDLWCDNNYRQGISIGSAQHLRVENCWFTNTVGTAPQAGVDIEPNHPYERLIDIVFEKCRFTGNTGGGILIAPISIDNTTLPMDITFNNCYVSNNGVNKYQISTYGYASGATGNVNFNNCMTDGGTYSVGGTKLASGYKANFNNCVFRNPTDIVINLDDHTTSSSGIRNGGMSFTNCLAFYNSTKRFFNVWHANTTTAGLDDVQFNNFSVINLNSVIYNNGGNVTANCVFNFQQFTSIPATTVAFTLGNSLLECDATNSLLNFSRDASSNTSFPIGMTYSITGFGVQGVDYSRMKGFEIIPSESLTQMDTFIVLRDTVVEPEKQNTVSIDISSLYSSSSMPQNVIINDYSALGLAPPTITASGTTVICPGQSVTLNAANVCNGCNVIWSNGETGLTINVSNPASYTAMVTNPANPIGCNTSPSSNAIIITTENSPGIPTISANGTTILCPGQSVILNAGNVCNGCTVNWSNGASGTSIAVFNAGVYTAMVASPNCGMSQASLPLVVGQTTPPPIAVVLPSGPIELCNGQTITLTASGNCPNCEVNWSNGGTGASQTLSTSGIYMAYFVDSCGTIGQASQEVQVNATTFKPSITVNNQCSLAATSGGSNYQWYLDGMLIPDAVTQFLEAEETGQYAVSMVNNAGCAGTSDSLFITGCSSATNDQENAFKLDVFPNPATNVLYFQFAIRPPIRLYLDFLTVDGQLVKTAFNSIEGIGSQLIKVNLADLADGIYLYRLRSEEAVTVGRILVVK